MEPARWNWVCLKLCLPTETHNTFTLEILCTSNLFQTHWPKLGFNKGTAKETRKEGRDVLDQRDKQNIFK